MLEVGEEHVFGAAEADAFSAELAGFASVLRGVSVGTDSQATHAVAPLHQRLVGSWELRSHQVHLPGVDDTFSSVQSDPLPFLHILAADGHGLRFIVDVELFCADDAALSPAAGDHSGVTGLATGRG